MVALAGSKLDVNPSTPDVAAATTPARINWEIERQGLAIPDAAWQQQKPVITISGPPGYGKSTLLLQWRKQWQAAGRRVVLIKATPGDRDGDKLILDMAAELQPAEAESASSFLDRFGSAGQVAVLKALLAEADSGNLGTTLIIDDVHELLEQPAEAVLRMLLRYQSETLTLVFAGRVYPAGVVSVAMLEGRLTRLNTTDLALSKAESAQLLEQHGIEAREALVTTLIERTQGWPAAVRLVALSLQHDPQQQDHFVGALAENPRPLTEYLNESVLSRLPEHLRSFLNRLALLRRFSADLAAAATGERDAGLWLEELESRGIPLTHTDELDPQYTLHPLVRDFLLTRLRTVGGSVLSETRDRACDWYSQHGEVDGAIEVSLEGGDLERAAALIKEHSEYTIRRYGRHKTFLYWTNKFPQTALDRLPEIQIQQAWSLDFLRRHEESENLLTAVEHGQSLAPGAPQSTHLQCTIEMQRCVQAGLRDHAKESVARSERWLARWPEADRYDQAAVHAVLAFAYKALSDYEEGLRHARQGLTLGREANGHYILSWNGMLAISNLVKKGWYRQATHECRQYIEELAPRLGNRSPCVMMLHAMQAGLLYEFDRIAEASDELGQGMTALMEQSSADPMIMGFVTLARLQALQGNPLEAFDTLAEGEALGHARDLPRLAISLGAERVVMHLRHGELEQARAVWDEVQRATAAGSRISAFESAVRDKSSRIHARMALLHGDYEAVCEILGPIVRHTRQTGQKRKLIETLLLQALSLQASNEQRKALKVFTEALQLGAPEGYIRLFADEGRQVGDLLELYLHETREDQRAPTVAYARQLLDAIVPPASSETDEVAETTSRRHSPDQSPLIEPLTSREIQILLKLQSGLPNRKLADSLLITEGTLKWHLRNIYGKLAVTSRLAAVTRAHKLGLLDAP